MAEAFKVDASPAERAATMRRHLELAYLQADKVLRGDWDFPAATWHGVATKEKHNARLWRAIDQLLDYAWSVTDEVYEKEEED